MKAILKYAGLTTLGCALLLSACSDNAPASDGGGGEGVGGAGAAGGAGGQAAADPLGLESCAAPAPTLGDPLAVPVIDWPASDEQELTCALRALDLAMESARVVCLGENSHGVRQSSRWHAVIARYLIHRWNVREISLEAPGAGVEAWNRYLENGNLGDLSAGFDAKGTLADTEEQERLLEALRAARSELGSPLRLTGFDVAVAFDTTLDHVVAFFDTVAPGVSPDPATSLGSGGYGARAAAADELAADIEANEAAYREEVGEEAVDAALRDTRNLADGFRFLERYFQNDFSGGNKLYREPGMIRNIEASLSRLAAGERLLLIAHNGHCGRTMSASGVPSEYATFPAVGAHLAMTQADGYFVLGQFYGGGQQLLQDQSTNNINPSFGYLEYLLNKKIAGDAALFSTASSFADLSKSYEAWNLEALTPSEQFDALLFLRTVAPVTMR